ncbi:MAG TPA: hypothetical protein VN026_11855 [Bacteroidia bacterium]|jgi:hypothetical protein|nr:hypothetical protein [Bacteroidia bacterium]
MKHTFFLLALLICFKMPAQDKSKAESQRLMNLLQKLEGTYQLQIINSRDKTELPLYLMDTIQAKRHITDVVYYKYKGNVRLMILPFAEINKKDFKRLERVVHISSEK